MVYHLNLLEFYRDLKEDEVLRIGFNSGKVINNIVKSDKMFVMNDDIVIERRNREGRCKIVIDCNTVETVNIITKED